MNKDLEYDNMTKEQLIQACITKYQWIDTYISSCSNKIINKQDIMTMYKCESNKALRILKLLFQMGYGNKIGKEYYVSQKALSDFTECMAGKEVMI